MTDPSVAAAPASGWQRFVRLLVGRLQPQASGRGAGFLGVAAAAVALLLLLIRSLLYAPSGWGIEDFLGWPDGSPGSATAAMLQLWDRSHRGAAVWLYLAADSMLFVPLYTAFLLTVALALLAALGDDDPDGLSRLERVLLSALATPVIALAVVDLLENALGLARTGLVGAVLGAGVTLATAALLWRVNRLRAVLLRLGPWIGATMLLAAPLILVSGMATGPACQAPATAWIWRAACGAHQAKGWLALAATGVLLFGAGLWLFGVRLHAGRPSDRQNRRRHSRAQLRAALWDIFVRSRYVLLALVMVAGLTVVMDQGRDVVYAVAASPFREGDFSTADRALLGLGTLVAFGITGVAVWMLVFACWLWTRSACQIRSAHGTSDPQDDGAARPQDSYAKNWARALGAAPVVLMVLLCAGVVQDSVMAQGAEAAAWTGPVFTVLAFAAALVLAGVHFLRRRTDAGPPEVRYHDCLDWRMWSERAGFWKGTGDAGMRKYSFAGRISPYTLPLVLWGGMLGCRLLDVFPAAWVAWEVDFLPSMALPVVLFAIALWLCFFGWLSVLEVRRSTPWVGLVIVAVGALGAMGLTDNHIVWPAVEPVAANPAGALRMLGFTGLLALLLIGGYLWAMHMVRRVSMPRPDAARGPGAPGRVGWRDAGVPAALLLLTAALLAWADHAATSRRPAGEGVAPAWSRPTLDIALADWLEALCGGTAPGPCRSPLPPGDDGGVPVYFVSSEGGGIRAAVWTAFVLHRFAGQDPHFLDRTFSMSGVSGGAVGAAVFRACGADGQDRGQCLRRFAHTDMLSPLLSAWMFEDLLARLLPTSWCRTPACGFLSRGAWFEQTLETGAGGLREGLIASRERQRGSGRHLPYLFLNATWVESGERAIASDLSIDWRLFRGAKDQLLITGHDMPLGTAAHNAARFPFINAIGALEAPRPSCLSRLREPPGGPVQEREAATPAREVCGHLADGGYFDNSGGQSTLDAVQGLARCLQVQPGDADEADYRRCVAMAPQRRQWLREHLVPQVLMIRNGVNPASAREEICPATRDRPMPTAEDVVPTQVTGCSGLTERFYAPERPVCRQRAAVFVDFVGPALAALNVGGIGANGQLAEARQAQGIRALRAILGGRAGRSALPPTAVVDLLPDGVRYPLGWHLSAVAVQGMWSQAQSCTR